ncbi:MAG TPA: hypothetical protein VFV92_11370, partial [Candidatus Bathyarchaeia archaeon]|nr:hypothetical protein [Candidatus Bathyarchaeia archaeon]
LPRGEQQDPEAQAIADPEQDAEEMPVPGHAYGMPVARQPDPRREIAGVILGGPDAVPRHFDWVCPTFYT